MGKKKKKTGELSSDERYPVLPMLILIQCLALKLCLQPRKGEARSQRGERLFKHNLRANMNSQGELLVMRENWRSQGELLVLLVTQ